MNAIRDAFEEHAVVHADARAMIHDVERVAERIGSALDDGAKVLVAGNGGSAADSQHFAAELVVRFVRNRAAWPAIALTVDSSVLTAISNDLGFEQVFARQVEALAVPGDVLVAISTSGDSPNVLAAARTARQLGCAVIALTGRDGGRLRSLADLTLAVPSSTVARVQEMHALCLHAVVAWLEDRCDGGVQ